MTLYELLPIRRHRSNVPVKRAGSRYPFDEMDKLRNELFGDFFGDFALGPFGASEVRNEFVPRVNVTEDEKNIYLSAELPGIKQEDVEISVTEDALTIKGEKKRENEEKRKNCYCSERSYGSFERVLGLPEHVDSEKAEAAYSEGVLTITLPKVEPEKSKARKIAIKNK